MAIKDQTVTQIQEEADAYVIFVQSDGETFADAKDHQTLIGFLSAKGKFEFRDASNVNAIITSLVEPKKGGRGPNKPKDEESKKDGAKEDKSKDKSTPPRPSSSKPQTQS